jgi:hypothetical protein
MVTCCRSYGCFECCLGSVFGIFFTGVFAGGWVGSVVYGLYTTTKYIHEINSMAATNCTILDATMNYDDDDNSGWLIHASYMIPTQLGVAANTSMISSLYGTDYNAHYFVNETLPCWVSTYNFYTVTISPFHVDGGTIFGLVILILMALPVAAGVVYIALFICVGASTVLSNCFKSIKGKTRQSFHPVDATETIEVDEAGYHWNQSQA